MTLNNRSIFILSVCSLFLFGCAQNKSQSEQATVMDGECKDTNVLVQERHLVMSAKGQKQENLVACFRNFLKFEENKEQEIKTCNQISIRRNGTVSFVQIRSVDNRVLPKDFKWCLEQEYWKMSFKALQIDRSHIITFPLNFSSVKK